MVRDRGTRYGFALDIIVEQDDGTLREPCWVIVSRRTEELSFFWEVDDSAAKRWAERVATSQCGDDCVRFGMKPRRTRVVVRRIIAFADSHRRRPQFPRGDRRVSLDSP